MLLPNKYAKGSYMYEETEMYNEIIKYNLEKIEEHQNRVKEIIRKAENSAKGYDLERKDVEEFLKAHPERKQKLREYGHRMPMVEDID